MAVNTEKLLLLFTTFSCYFMICKTVSNDLEDEIIYNLSPVKRDIIFMCFVIITKYEEMAHLLFPPDLSTINKYQYDYFDWEIVENEIRIQRVISDIYDTKIEVDTENKDFKDDEIEVDIENKDFKDDEIEVDFENTDFKDDEIEVDFENTDFKDSFKMYERALDIRKRLLLPVMQRLLYNILDSEKMCCTDSGMKCRLVALMIQCSDNRRLIKNATCKNKMCIISETVQDEENHKKSQTDEHTFYDVEKNDSFYTYFVDRNGIDKPWIEIVFD